MHTDKYQIPRYTRDVHYISIYLGNRRILVSSMKSTVENMFYEKKECVCLLLWKGKIT